MSSMVKEEAKSTVKLTGLRIYRWNDQLARNFVPPNKALFAFIITTKKHEIIKHSPLVIDFQINSLGFMYDLALKLVLKTDFFSSETALRLAQQVTDYINSCISFHLLKSCACRCRRCSDRCNACGSNRPRLVFVADVVLDADHIKEPQENHSYLWQDYSIFERDFETAYTDFSQYYLSAADLDDIQELTNVENILKSWIEGRLINGLVHSYPLHKKRKLNEHQESCKSRISGTVKRNLCFDLSKVKPTLEFIDQVSDYVDDNDCAICFRNLSENAQTVKMVCCKHEFHSHCIFRWLTINQSCPYCRKSSLFRIYL